MMKRLLVLFAAVLLLMPCALAQPEAIVDRADILSAAQERDMSARIDAILEEYGFQVMLYLVDDGQDIYALRVAAADEYEARGFKGQSGIILALDVSSRKYYFVTAGKGRQIFDDPSLDYMENTVLPALRSSRFAQAAGDFIIGTETVLSDSSLAKLNGTFGGIVSAMAPYVPMAALFGALLATIILVVRIRGMRTRRPRNAANDYLINVNLTRRADVYLYTTEVRHRIQTDTGSHSGGGGGGSFHSSSGGSYGGRGGSF